MTIHQLKDQKVTKVKMLTTVYQGKPVIETLTNGYFILDDKWTVRHWNKAAEKLLNVAEEDIIGKNLWEYFAYCIPVEFYAVYNNAFISDIPKNFREYWGEKGAWFDVTTWHGENTLCVSFKKVPEYAFENVETTRERLKTITELYKFVTEVTNDCLWEWDLRTNEIFWIDGGHKRVFGYPIENSLVPVSFWEKCIHPDDRSRVLGKLNKVISKGAESKWEDEYRFRKADGEYSMVCDRGHIVFDENNFAARIIGATQDISKRHLLENQLAAQKTTQQQEITSAVITALENERTSIGTQLYDNLAQLMATTKMCLQMVKRTQVNREANIEKAIGYVEQVIKTTRKISKALIIPPSHIISLSDNIRILIADIVADSPIVIKFLETSMSETELPGEWQINIFRIIQDQMNNIIKHSGATKASITLSRFEQEIILLIKDNGNGYGASKEEIGVGIINIKARMALCNGSLTIKTRPGSGYELRASFPLSIAGHLSGAVVG
jgi:PAS domain S-box-containing protein